MMHRTHKNVKTRIVAVLLTMTTAVSVVSAAAVPASAATDKEKTEKIVMNVAETGLKSTIKVLTAGNPVAGVLADMGFSAFDGIMGMNAEDPNAKVLDKISDLSDNLDAYHDEEMSAMTRLSDQIGNLAAQMQQMADHIDERFDGISAQQLEYFKTLQLGSFKNRVDQASVHFSPWFDCLEVASDYLGNKNAADSNGVLTDKAYSVFSYELSKADGGKMKEDLSFLARYVSGNSTELNGQSAYRMLTDLGVVSELSGFSYDNNAESAAYLNDVKKLTDGIQAEMNADYAAYLTYLQMKYQCEMHDAVGDDHQIGLINANFTTELNRLSQDIQAVQSSYEDSRSYFESKINATVELQKRGEVQTDEATGKPFKTCGTVKTYYFASVPVAWAATVQTADCKTLVGVNYDWVNMTLRTDWTDNGKGLMGGLPVPRNNHPAFAVSASNKNLNLPCYYPVNRHLHVNLELNGHKMSVNSKALYNDMHSYEITPYTIYVYGVDGVLEEEFPAKQWLHTDNGLVAQGIITNTYSLSLLDQQDVSITNHWDGTVTKRYCEYDIPNAEHPNDSVTGTPLTVTYCGQYPPNRS